MAISRTPLPAVNAQEPLLLYINNGDQKSLKEVVDRLKFKDEESLLRFLIAVISQSATTSLTITDKNAKVTALSPNPSLISDEAVPTDT